MAASGPPNSNYFQNVINSLVPSDNSQSNVSSVQRSRSVKEYSLLEPLLDEGYLLDIVSQSTNPKDLLERYSRSSSLDFSKLPDGFSDIVFSTVPVSKLRPTIEEPITYALVLPKRFPFDAPKVLCLSRFTFPSIADGRDLAFDILGRDWSPVCTLLSILSGLGSFTVNVELWNRHLNRLISDGYLTVKATTHPVQFGYFQGRIARSWFTAAHNSSQRLCNKIIDDNEQPRCLILTEGAFLCTEVLPAPRKNNTNQALRWGAAAAAAVLPMSGPDAVEDPTESQTIEVRCWYFLHQLMSLTHNKATDMIVLKFRGHPTQEDRILSFLFEDSTAFLRDLQTRMQALGLPSVFVKAQYSLRRIQAELSRLSAILNDDTEAVTLEFIQRLNQLYQSEVELLSSTPQVPQQSAQMSEALGRLHEMLRQPKVQAVLAGGDDTAS
eukprot:Filipodium_phascolosomae@DN1520_c0_g1_i2.p1